MKTIGIIGGMSWESTIEYYRFINQKINRHFKDLSSGKILLESYDFEKIARLQSSGDWEELGEIMINSAIRLQNSGADFVAIATNTMHILANQVQSAVDIPLIHIAEATSKAILKDGFNKALLLGTRYTMSQDFYKATLKKNGIEVIVPTPDEQLCVNEIIFGELCRGIVNEKSKKDLDLIIENSKNLGAQAVILACTELPLIIKEANLPLIDTLYIHCDEIVDRMLG